MEVATPTNTILVQIFTVTATHVYQDNVYDIISSFVHHRPIAH